MEGFLWPGHYFYQKKYNREMCIFLLPSTRRTTGKRIDGPSGVQAFSLKIKQVVTGIQRSVQLETYKIPGRMERESFAGNHKQIQRKRK